VLQELRSGRLYRTDPRGVDIDLEDPWLDVGGLDVETSELKIVRGQRRAKPPIMKRDLKYVGLEIWDGEVPPPPPPVADAAVASPARRRPSDAAVEQCFGDIKNERPDDPPDEEWMFKEMTRRLGASPRRERLRALWKRIAPEWKRPVGAQRKFISAKKSAV
jgi:hypothetical protein